MYYFAMEASCHDVTPLCKWRRGRSSSTMRHRPSVRCTWLTDPRVTWSFAAATNRSLQWSWVSHPLQTAGCSEWIRQWRSNALMGPANYVLTLDTIIFILPKLVDRKTNKVGKKQLNWQKLNNEIPIVLLIQTLQSPGTFYTKYFCCIAICLEIYFFV